MIKYRPLSIVCGIAAAFATGCPNNNQVLLPPPGSTAGVGPAGQHVYVSDFQNPGVTRIISLPVSSSSTVSGTVAGANAPAGMAFDSSNRLFVANFGSSQVQAFAQPISNGNSPAFTIATPHQAEDVAFDSTGNMYVAECCNDTIDVFNAPLSGSSTLAFSFSLGAGVDGRGVAFDGSGNLYVNTSNGIERFTPPFSSGSTPSAHAGSGANIHGIAFNAHDGMLYQAASSTTIDAYALPLTNTSTKAFSVTVPAAFDYFAFDSLGDLFVASSNSNLYVYTPPLSASSAPVLTVALSGLNIPGVAVGP